ncbi:MAG: transglutaminase-like domain-containing protein [Ruthenibacterium sp.]
MPVSRYNRRIIALLCIGLLLCACTSDSAKKQLKAQAGSYVPKGYSDAAFHADSAVGENGLLLDLSAVDKGYVAVSAVADKRLKFQVAFGETAYNYDLPGDGTPTVFPLQLGDGTYRLRVMINTEESRYLELYAQQAEVVLSSEFEPFLRASQMVNYKEDSACVARARELAQSADSESAFMNAVYEYVKNTITYDYDKAKKVADGELNDYLPNPDETLQSKTGICFDYAALVAAMLRSQGIPTKVIMGYVKDGSVYHAWNMVYLQDRGWVTVNINVPNHKWQPIDLTFAAAGTDEALEGNADDYVQRYLY